MTTGVSLAQGNLEVISLRYRTADQVIPVLQPLLEAGGALSGQGNQLIVRTSPANLDQLRQVLDAIDRPARRLLISVRFDSRAESERASAEGGVRISSRSASVAGQVGSAQTASDERVDQQVQVLEGGQASISTGEARRYSEAATGMIVVPRLAGDTVTLEVLAQQEVYAHGGAVRGQAASSVIRGRLGEWIELGGAAAQGARSDSGVLGRRDASTAEERRIWLKVEELR